MHKALLFDLDGTLLDTAPEFFSVMNKLRTQRALPPISFSALRQTVSNGSPGMLKASFDVDSTSADFESLKAEFLDGYRHSLSSQTVLFPGINALLKAWEASNQPWGIVTNKPSWLATPLIEKMNLSKRCQTLVCGDTLAVNKPDPAPLLLAAEQLGVPPKHCYYVGDHHNDMIAAKAAGMISIAVGYGYLAPQETPNTWSADYIVNTPTALHKLLQDVTDNSF